MEHHHLHTASSSSRPTNDYVDLTESPPAPLKPLSQSTANNRAPPQPQYATYIKPAKAFTSPLANAFVRPTQVEGWPHWVQPKPAKAKPVDEGENFDLDAVKMSADDWTKHEGDAEAHMRELLSAAVGEVDEDIKDGEDAVEGFADAVRLMPHQIRGVKWMRGRESGRKFGGILADVGSSLDRC